MDSDNVPEPEWTAIRPQALEKLKAVALVREMDTIDLLDEVIEAARAKLSPKPKPAPSSGRGRRPKAES